MRARIASAAMPLLDQPTVVVDLETTGANSSLDRVTEIGILQVEGGRILREWSSLVNPETAIPPFIESMTGITNAMVASAPTFRELRHELHALLRGRMFIAHNARFDYGFLQNEFHRVDLPFEEAVLCTVKLSRRLWPEHRAHGLDAIISRYGIVCAQRHRALGDAKALWEFLRYVGENVPAECVDAAALAVLRRAVSPSRAPFDPDSIPQSPGVYRFLGDDHVLLHVGRSTNLRARVTAYFAADPVSSRESRLVQKVRHVDWIETAGELGALLKESRLIEEDAPLHNRSRSRGRDLWSLRLDEVEPGRGCPVRVVGTSEFDPAALDRNFGLFRSPRAAEKALVGLAGEHGLCHKLLGLDSPSGACLACERNTRLANCVGQQGPELHHARLLAALAPLRLKGWPYRGRIGVREHHAATERTEIHLVDRWRYLGTAASEADLQSLLDARAPTAFDANDYRLLTRYLAAPRPGLRIIDL